jgi:DNA-binding transcriptional ArsR family regulator
MPRGRPKIDRDGPAGLLVTLADPTRLLILRALGGGEMRAMELAKACEEEAVNVTHHLMRLKREGLVTASGARNRAVYALAIGARLKATATALEFTHPSGLKVTLRIV